MSRIDIARYFMQYALGSTPTTNIDDLVRLYGINGVHAVLTAINQFAPDHDNFSAYAKLYRAQMATDECISVLTWTGNVANATAATTQTNVWKVPDLGLLGQCTVLWFQAVALAGSVIAGGPTAYLYKTTYDANGTVLTSASVSSIVPLVVGTTITNLGTLATVVPGDSLSFRFATPVAGDTFLPITVSAGLSSPLKSGQGG